MVRVESTVFSTLHWKKSPKSYNLSTFPRFLILDDFTILLLFSFPEGVDGSIDYLFIGSFFRHTTLKKSDIKIFV